jgi:hypothetical protein
MLEAWVGESLGDPWSLVLAYGPRSLEGSSGAEACVCVCEGGGGGL